MRVNSNQYDHFIGYQLARVEHYVLLLHELYQKKVDLHTVISNNKSYLLMLGFPYDIIDNLQQELPTRGYNPYDYDFDDNPKYLTLRSNLVAYSQIVTKKIPHVIGRIKHHTYLINMSKEVFKELYKTLNNEILKHLLQGRSYEFPSAVGMLKIERYPRCFNKKVVNYGESNKLKKTNPDNYIVFHLDDEYAAITYDKTNVKVANYKYYKFKLTKFINGYDRNMYKYYDTVESIDTLYKDTKVGAFDKMLATIHLHGIKHFDKHGV